MRLLLSTLLLTIVAIAVIDGAGIDRRHQRRNNGGLVHQFAVRHVEVPMMANEGTLVPKAGVPLVAHRRRNSRQRFSSDAAAAAGSSVLGGNATSWMLVGSASIGTPPQEFTVGFDVYRTDTYFIGKGAHVPDNSKMKSKKRYDQSASSTAVADWRTFHSVWGDISGHVVTDVLNLGGSLQALNVSVGVADRVEDSYGPIGVNNDVDAIIGISSSPNTTYCISINDGPWNCTTRTSNVSVPTQIVDTLAAPIITTYVNRSALNAAEWAGTVTLGGEDNANCEAGSYVYTPRVGLWQEPTIASITLNGTTFPLNGSVVLYYSYSAPLSVTDSVFDGFVAATGATYLPRTQLYHVNCAKVASLPNFTLNLGSDGSAPVTLHPSNYIKYDTKSHACTLNVCDCYADDADEIEVALGREFHNNHCVAQNIHDQTTGFANLKRQQASSSSPAANGNNNPIEE